MVDGGVELFSLLYFFLSSTFALWFLSSTWTRDRSCFFFGGGMGWRLEFSVYSSLKAEEK